MNSPLKGASPMATGRTDIPCQEKDTSNSRESSQYLSYLSEVPASSN